MRSGNHGPDAANRLNALKLNALALPHTTHLLIENRELKGRARLAVQLLDVLLLGGQLPPEWSREVNRTPLGTDLEISRLVKLGSQIQNKDLRKGLGMVVRPAFSLGNVWPCAAPLLHSTFDTCEEEGFPIRQHLRIKSVGACGQS